MGLELARAFITVRGDASGVRRDFTAMRGPMAKQASSLGKFVGKAFAGAMAIAGVVGFATIIRMAGQEAVGFEKKMVDVRANARLLGEQGTKAFQQLNSVARELGATTQFTAVQAAEALNKMVLAGLNAREAMEAVPSVLNLAASANLELAESAKIVVDNMRKYGLEAADTGRISDFLSSAQSRAQITARDLAQGLLSLGSIATSMNASFQDTMALLTGMGRAGTEMSRAGTALAVALGRLARQPKEVENAMKDLKIEIQDFVGPDGAFQIIELFRAIAEALDPNPIKRGRQAMELFGARGREILGILNLMRRGTFVEETQVGLLNDLGRAARVAEAKLNTFWGMLKKVRSAMGEFFIAALTPVLKSLEPFLDRVRDATVSIARLSEKAFEAFAVFRASPLGQLIGQFVQLVKVGTMVVGTLFAVKLGIIGVQFAFATLTGPIGITVGLLGAVGAAFVAIVGEGDTFSEKIQDVFENKIPEFIDTALFAFRNFGDIAQIAVIDIVQSALELFPEMEKPIGETVAFFVGAWESADVFFQNILGLWKAGLEELMNISKALALGFSVASESFFVGDFVGAGKAFGRAFTKAFAEQKDVEVGDVFGDMREAFERGAASTLDVLQEGGGLGNTLEEIRQELLDKIAARELKRIKDAEDAKAIIEKPEVEPPPPGEVQPDFFLEAGRFGFAEFGKTIQDAVLQRDDPQKKIVENTKEIVVGVEQLHLDMREFLDRGLANPAMAGSRFAGGPE